MEKIISGKELSFELKNQMHDEVSLLKEKYGRAPKLAVILVGNNPASLSYVRGKEKAAETVGITNETIHLAEDITMDELLAQIDTLNKADDVDGILVQLPLPKQIDEALIIEAIDINKDVDGFHPLNVSNLWLKKKCMLPCTPKGIIKLLDKAQIAISGKRAVVLGRSNIVGLPVAKLLLDRNATVTICHSKTENLASITREADILIAAIGKPKFVKREMIKDNAVVIDVGINRDLDGKLCGDVDFDDVYDKVSYITKVPGGVGPMTIACLMENTIEAFLNKMQ